jgi:hypothetical protein
VPGRWCRGWWLHVRLDNCARYVSNSGSQGVQLLRKNVNAFDEAIRIWSGPTADPDSGTKGYDRIVEQAGVKYTWEWFLIETGRPWASAVPPLVRDRIKTNLERRSRSAVANKEARTAEDERVARQKDDETIALMNARNAEAGKPALTERQEAMVRENLRKRRL